jgi:hypothetical protein
MKSLLIFALVGSSVGVLDGLSLREGPRNQGGTVKQRQVEAMTKAVARQRQDPPRSLASFLHEIDVLLTPEED